MKLPSFLLGLGAATVSTVAMAAPLPAMQLIGKGNQIYSCQHKSAGYSWTLKGPNAHLYDASGKMVARHYFGPRWQANDGSTIKGAVLDANASPQAGKDNAPWLVLHAVLEKGRGVFDHVNLVTRTDTEGGGIPKQACDAARNGQSVSVPYKALYTFFFQASRRFGQKLIRN